MDFQSKFSKLLTVDQIVCTLHDETIKTMNTEETHNPRIKWKSMHPNNSIQIHPPNTNLFIYALFFFFFFWKPSCVQNINAWPAAWIQIHLILFYFIYTKISYYSRYYYSIVQASMPYKHIPNHTHTHHTYNTINQYNKMEAHAEYGYDLVYMCGVFVPYLILFLIYNICMQGAYYVGYDSV